MLPNLIVIGAMKCATGSLHYYLNLHPEISMSKRKELNFFIIEGNWNNGIQWYESNFTDSAKVVGESSPNYTKYPIFAGVPKRLYSILPSAKLIYILRDPIDRIISHYIHNCAKGREKRTISESLVDLENSHYVHCSKYYMQLKQYLEYFQKTNILIITLEELKDYRRPTMQRIFEFLEVDKYFYCQEYSRILHQSKDKKRRRGVQLNLSKISKSNKFRAFLTMKLVRVYKLLYENHIEEPILNKKLKHDLVDGLKDDINHLRNYTGKDYKYWCL